RITPSPRITASCTTGASAIPTDTAGACSGWIRARFPRTRERIMSKLYTQLNFGGNCEAAFRCYVEHLGGKMQMIMRQNEAPGAPANASDAVIHARMEIGDTVLIGNDVPPA